MKAGWYLTIEGKAGEITYPYFSFDEYRTLESMEDELRKLKHVGFKILEIIKAVAIKRR